MTKTKQKKWYIFAFAPPSLDSCPFTQTDITQMFTTTGTMNFIDIEGWTPMELKMTIHTCVLKYELAKLYIIIMYKLQIIHLHACS